MNRVTALMFLGIGFALVLGAFVFDALIERLQSLEAWIDEHDRFPTYDEKQDGRTTDD